MGRPEPEGCRAPQVPEGAPDPLPRGDPDGARPGVSRRAPPPLREGGRKDPLRRAQAGLQGRRRASLSRCHLQGPQAGLQAGPPQVLPLRPPRTPLSPHSLPPSPPPPRSPPLFLTQIWIFFQNT